MGGVFPTFPLLFHSLGACAHGTQLPQDRLSALPAPRDVDMLIPNNSQEIPKVQAPGIFLSDTMAFGPLTTPLRHLNALCNPWGGRYPQWCCIRAAVPRFPSLAVVPEVPAPGGDGLCRFPCGGACRSATLGQALVTMPAGA